MNNTVNDVEESAAEPSMSPLHEVVTPHHKFGSIQYKGTPWDLSHLEAFALRLDPGLGFEIDIVILFSCHCFTHSLDKDVRPKSEIPDNEIFVNSRERRVLNEERYLLSRQYLPKLIHELPKRKIQVAGESTPNFMTLEFIDSNHVQKLYAVFFEVEKDRDRKRRVLLRVQSAYILDALTHRKQKAGKVGFNVLLRAAYNGRIIHG